MAAPVPTVEAASAPPSATRRPSVSFELFPPRTDAAAIALGRTIDRLAEVDPSFLSVTFGAGGTSRGRSLTVLKYILEQTSIEPMAHLTCVGSSHDEANRLVREFLDAGICSFLALRGDPPVGGQAAATAGDGGIGDLASAAELVQLIHRVQHEREPFAQVDMPGIPGAKRIRARSRPERVAVAAFPNGHPRSQSLARDVDVLLAKQAAGATLAITQLFWRADEYLGFVELARSGGVTIPILPGVMPVTAPARLARLQQLTEEVAPAELRAGLSEDRDAVSRHAFGVEFITRLIDDVLAGGAPGIHLYTFNRHELVLDVLARLEHDRVADRPTVTSISTESSAR